MTTGRINQVAFLGDTTTRTTPDAVETRGRDGRGSRSYRARAGLEMGGRRGGGPGAGIAFCIRKHERSRAGQFGGSPLDWNTGAAARPAARLRDARRGGTASHSRSTEGGEAARLEHGRRCWARRAPPRRAAERDSFTFEFHRSGYAAQEPRLAARHPGGLGPRVMGAAGRQFGAPARSLPTRTARLPLMRL